jgi:hypothetical protein
MAAPIAIAAGRKAAPVARAAARKASDNSGAVLLIGAIGLVMLTRAVKAIPTLPDVSGAVDIAKAPFDWLGGEIDDLIKPPSGQFSPSDPLAELRGDLMTARRFTNRSTAFLGGIVQGPDMDDPGPEYYGRVHYDDAGVPIAVPVEINRPSRQLGERVRGWLPW